MFVPASRFRSLQARHRRLRADLIEMQTMHLRTAAEFREFDVPDPTKREIREKLVSLHERYARHITILLYPDD